MLLFIFSIWTSPAFSAEREISAYSRAAAAYNERDLDAALRHAKEAVAQEPDNADARVLLGQLHYLRQDLKKAKESWQKAFKLAPGRSDLRELLEKLERETALEKSLAKSDTHPFIVRYAKGQVPVENGSLRDMLRDAHRKVGQQFDYFPGHPISVLLYPEADFDQVKGISHQVAGLYDGKIRLPLKPGRMDRGQLQAILWHEYTHALVHDLAQGRCPMWLNEGLATLQEAWVREVDTPLARAAFLDGKLPAWDQLWSEQSYDQATLLLNYQTSHLIARYLIRRGRWKGMADLLARLGRGDPIREALKAQYRTDPDGLEKEWRAWLRRNL